MFLYVLLHGLPDGALTMCIAVLAGHSRSMQLDSDYSADAVAIVTSGTAKGAKRASGKPSIAIVNGVGSGRYRAARLERTMA